VAPGIAGRFNELGYHFEAVSPGGYKIFDENGKTKTEIDILLENSKHIIAVEVKSRVQVKDIEHHIKRLEILKEHHLKKNDNRIILGAMAGAVFGNVEKTAVAEAGFYVLEQSGDTMKMDVPDGFTPREW
jgi:midasin (ATPase involved in ribosome maturation)